MSTSVTYLFDPLCGWCYGASPVIQKLWFNSGIDLQLATTGLFFGWSRSIDIAFSEFAWANDQRIAKLTGQCFTDTYRRNVLGRYGSKFNSAAMTMALTAVHIIEPQRELEVLNALQEARYLQGLDTENPLVVGALLRNLGLDAAAEQLGTSDQAVFECNSQRLVQARNLMQSMDSQGVPSLVVHSASGDRLLGADSLFSDFEKLVDQILGT